MGLPADVMDDPRSSPALSSPSNPRIRAAAALRDRRERDATGLTIVDGARELRRALAAGVEVVEAFVCDPLLAGEDARTALDGLEALAAAGVPVHHTTGAAFAKLAFGERAEGLVAVIRAPSLALAALDVPAAPLLVVIEGVEKPGNVGAVLRSADGAGADAVIVASPRTDLANPNVIRASAGTVFSMMMAAAPSEEVVAWLRARRIRILAARVEVARPYTDVDLSGGVALVLGAEDRGLTDAWTGDDIEAIHLPMAGAADSLNVSVTAAVLLYEARRQRDRLDGEAD
jgi:TrmH family RNA methyltransferase